MQWLGESDILTLYGDDCLYGFSVELQLESIQFCIQDITSVITMGGVDLECFLCEPQKRVNSNSLE